MCPSSGCETHWLSMLWNMNLLSGMHLLAPVFQLVHPVLVGVLGHFAHVGQLAVCILSGSPHVVHVAGQHRFVFQVVLLHLPPFLDLDTHSHVLPPDTDNSLCAYCLRVIVVARQAVQDGSSSANK